MTTPERIKTLAHLLAGDEPGWQSRFAARLDVSRGYAHNLLTGERPLTPKLRAKIAEVALAQAEVYRARAVQLDLEALSLDEPVPVAPAPAEPPLPHDKEEYERDTDECIDFIVELAYSHLKDEDK